MQVLASPHLEAVWRKQLADGLTQMNCDLSAEKIDKLLIFLHLLQRWSAVYNLTAIRDPQQVISYHLLDSLSLLASLQNLLKKGDSLLDVGSGAGLPGIILAVAKPQWAIHLSEPVKKKCAFLQQAKLELDLSNIYIHNTQVENISSEVKFAVITARAFSSLARIIELAQHLLAKNGAFMMMKGLLPNTEIADLPPDWEVKKITPVSVPMLSAQRHFIEIKKIANPII